MLHKFKVPFSTKSLRFRIIACITVTMMSLLLLLLFVNLYAIGVVRRQVFDSNSRTLNLYMQEVDDAFSDVDKYLVGLHMSDPTLLSMSYTNDDNAYFVLQAQMKAGLESAIPSYGKIDTFFVYDDSRDFYFDAAKYTTTGSMRSQMHTMIVEYINSGQFTNTAGKWISMQYKQEYYLVRILKFRDFYIGSCADINTLVEGLRKTGFDDMDYISFYQNNGTELGSLLPKLTQEINFVNNNEYYSVDNKKNRYMLLTADSSCGNYSMVALIQDNSVLEGLSSFQTLVQILLLSLIIIIPFIVIIVQRWVIRPIGNLTRAMQRFAKGDLEVNPQSEKTCEEFTLANQTFAEMTKQITALKIDVYEEKVQRQRAQLQYLQLQIKPHFFINCLNVMNNLSRMNENGLVQKMTEYLGNHLRYTLHGNSLECLEKELEYVKNYLRIQELRRSNSVSCHYDIDPEVLNAAVPPLVLHTYVENTMKHQAVAGEQIDIYIRIKKIRKEGTEEPYIEITVWDTGDGFSEEILDCLQHHRRIYDSSGEHIGMFNVEQRIDILYNGRGSVQYSNDETVGGAKIQIQLPYIVDDGRTGAL